MRILLVGGPVEEGFSIPVPGRWGDLPPWVCWGGEEPYQHYVRRPGQQIYKHVGDCKDIDHHGSYPHQRDSEARR